MEYAAEEWFRGQVRRGNANFNAWKRRCGERWRPHDVSTRCCPFWLENGYFFEDATEEAYGSVLEDFEVDMGSHGCGRLPLSRRAAIDNVDEPPPPHCQSSAHGKG